MNIVRTMQVPLDDRWLIARCSADILALAGLRSRYPNATESELRRRLADLWLGKELACKVYGEMNRAE